MVRLRGSTSAQCRPCCVRMAEAAGWHFLWSSVGEGKNRCALALGLTGLWECLLGLEPGV